jgi:hypothetical protein
LANAHTASFDMSRASMEILVELSEFIVSHAVLNSALVGTHCGANSYKCCLNGLACTL